MNSDFPKTYKVLSVPTVLIFSHGLLVERKIRIRATKLISKKIPTLKSLTFEEAKMREIRGMSINKSRGKWSFCLSHSGMAWRNDL